MPSNQEARVVPSSDEEFSAALELSIALYRKKAFEVRTWTLGVDIAVDDDVLEREATAYEIDAARYREILDREIDVLLTAEILKLGDPQLAQAPPLRDIDEEGLNKIVSRRERVRALFPIARFIAELRAKRDCVANVLAGVSWDVVHSRSSSCDKPRSPMALVRITSTPEEMVSIPKQQGSDMQTLMLSLAPPESHLFGCTPSDLDYLIRQLRGLRDRLMEHGKEEHVDDPHRQA